MSARAPGLLCWLAFSILLLWPSAAEAWVETMVFGHHARVEVERDGHAIVRHELLIKLRGGPMKVLEVGGIGTGIEPIPDAMVRRAQEGSSGAWPLSLAVMEDGGLRLNISADQGIRGGSYLFEFAYHTSLLDAQQVRFLKEGVELSFVGPRLTTGVDSAKVTFVVPRASLAPQVSDSDQSEAGVLLGELRRGPDHDEIELVRAHVAAGEPAVWRVLVGKEALSAVAASEQPGALSTTAGGSSGAARSYEVNDKGLVTPALVLAGLIGVFYGLLVYLKAMTLVRAAREREARVKPLVPSPPLVRGALSALALSASGFFALDQEPGWAVGALVVAVGLSTHLLPVRVPRPRGPGSWESVPGQLRPSPLRPLERVFETRTLAGFSWFTVLASGILLAAYRILPSSNYLALMTVTLLVPLLPLFFTGRLLDLPESPLVQARPWFKFLERAVDPSLARVELWGRRAATGHAGLSNELIEYDETRLRIVLTEPPKGLRGLEISFEEAAGACVLPCVVLRVLEDSPARRCLPSDIPWQRGRTVEERVAVLRPSAPTKVQLLRLLKSLVANLRAAGLSQSERSERSSSGRGDSAAKSGTPLAAPAM